MEVLELLQDRSTKAGAETPATRLIGAEHLHGCNSETGLQTPDRNFDHWFGPCLGVDVVTNPQMSSKSATNHNFAKRRLNHRGFADSRQSTQGSPSSWESIRPNRIRALEMPLLNLYTITESTRSSIAS